MTRADMHAEVDAEYNRVIDLIPPDRMFWAWRPLYNWWAAEKRSIESCGHRLPIAVNIRVPEE